MKLVFGLKSVSENPYPREPFQYIFNIYIFWKVIKYDLGYIDLG